MVLQYQHLEKWNGGADYLRTECLDYKKVKEMDQKVNEYFFMDVKTKDAVRRFVLAWVKCLTVLFVFSLLLVMGRTSNSILYMLLAVELFWICIYSETDSILNGCNFEWEGWKREIIDFPGLIPFRVVKVALYNKCIAVIGKRESIGLDELYTVSHTRMSRRRFKKYIKSMCDDGLFKHGYLVWDMFYLSKDAEIHHAGEKYGSEFEHQVIQLSLHSEKDKAE